MFILHPGVAEAFTAFTPHQDKREGLQMLRELKQRMEPFMREVGVHRLQACVRADHIAANRMARAVGMEFEGLMPKFDSEQNDYIRYAKVI